MYMCIFCMYMYSTRQKKLAIPSLRNTWCVVTKEQSSNGAPTLNAVVRSGRRYRLNAHVLKLTTHVFKKRRRFID